MKKCILALVLFLPFIYASASFAGARGGDSAWAVLHGEPDRLHQPWAGDPQPPQYGTRDPQKTPEQKTEPQRSSRDEKANGGDKK